MRVKVNIRFSQFDRSLVEKISGVKGGICTLCKVTRKDANNIDRVREGFEINRNAKDTIEFAKILFNEDGSYKQATKKLTSDEREGLTGHPIETGELEIALNIPVLHAHIHSLGHFEHIAFYHNARHAFPNNTPIQGLGQSSKKVHHDETSTSQNRGTKRKRGGQSVATPQLVQDSQTPVEKPKRGKTIEQKNAVEKAKREFMAKAKAKEGLNLPLNAPNPSGTGGNCDNGNMAKQFFSPENREKVLDLYEPFDETTQREEMRRVLQGFNVILRVMSSTRKIHCAKFNEFNRKIYCDLLTLFPWMQINDTVHQMFHSAQFIRDYNSGYALGDYSESALESSDKCVRNFREYLARFVSLFENLTDIVTLLYLHVSPIMEDWRLSNPPFEKFVGRKPR